ncbi:hypothetical protein Sango_2742400 [Sesamum angolense]|uniref:Retrotransposon gag domain-containing protein n=1 Tax=Sesamum angolense TaxID=2727404 RepID=A0AAE1T964_9LAMI|nr:hypothetical protein Sango_2742400 [Sesamum angolense]
MPMGYQPPKFQQFDGKGNPKQHVAHFVETYNKAGTYGDHLVKQFVRSLKGNSFDWYTDLEVSSIDGWEQLEQEFLNRFYNTRRTVGMVELTNSRQWKEEPVIDYINRNEDPRKPERKDDPKYCKYHRLVGHAIQDCFVFKDKVMQLARQVTFTDEDLLLGSKPHNRPLFVADIRLMIQGFNQGGQRAVGIIRMQLTMEDMVSSALFHVIDAKTSYNMLLDRP